MYIKSEDLFRGFYVWIKGNSKKSDSVMAAKVNQSVVTDFVANLKPLSGDKDKGNPIRHRQIANEALDRAMELLKDSDPKFDDSSLSRVESGKGGPIRHKEVVSEIRKVSDLINSILPAQQNIQAFVAELGSQETQVELQIAGHNDKKTDSMDPDVAKSAKQTEAFAMSLAVAGEPRKGAPIIRVGVDVLTHSRYLKDSELAGIYPSDIAINGTPTAAVFLAPQLTEKQAIEWIDDTAPGAGVEWRKGADWYFLVWQGFAQESREATFYSAL